MKISVAKPDLIGALADLAPTVSSSANTIPILQCIKVETADDHVILNSTNLEQSIRMEIAADIHIEGAVSIPILPLQRVVKNLPEGPTVDLDLDKETLQIKIEMGKSKILIRCQPSEDFPALQHMEATAFYSLGNDKFKDLLTRAGMTASKVETQVFLNGVHLSARTDTLVAEATDRYIASRIAIALPEGAEETPDIIIPNAAVRQMLKILPDTDTNINISASATTLSISFNSLTFTTRLVDGKFPDLKQIIAEDYASHFSLEMDQFAPTIRRVAALCSSEGRNKRIRMTFSSDGVHLASSGPEGSADDFIENPQECPNPFTVRFDSKYLLDLLTLLKSDRFLMRCNGDRDPCLITDDQNEAASFILQPIKGD